MYTKKYKEKLKAGEGTSSPKQNSDDDVLKKCKNIIIQVQSKSNERNSTAIEENNSEYVPMSTKKPLEERLGQPEYIPTNIDNDLNYEDDYTKYSEEDIEENSLQSITERYI